MAKKIKLSNGKLVLVNDKDFTFLSKFKWSLGGAGYAYRRRANSEKAIPRNLYMHRQIMGAKTGQEVDHRNRDKLDNRRMNLRFCTRAENQRNLIRKNKSGAKGVSNARGGKYSATIFANGEHYFLGIFKSKQKAAAAYNKAAKKHHGKFAYLNNIKTMKALEDESTL